jgi:hypothetical protein
MAEHEVAMEKYPVFRRLVKLTLLQIPKANNYWGKNIYLGTSKGMMMRYSLENVDGVSTSGFETDASLANLDPVPSVCPGIGHSASYPKRDCCSSNCSYRSEGYHTLWREGLVLLSSWSRTDSTNHTTPNNRGSKFLHQRNFARPGACRTSCCQKDWACLLGIRCKTKAPEG